MPKRTRPLSHNEATSRLRRMLIPIRRDVKFALKVEAALEEGNRVVIGRAEWGQFEGSGCYNTLKDTTSLLLTLLLAKLFELPRPRPDESPAKRHNRSDVASIPLMLRLMKQRRCRRTLLAEARLWTPSIEDFADTNEKVCAQAIDASVSMYSDLKRQLDGRHALRTLTTFRNTLLAHNLLDAAMRVLPTYNQLFLLTDVARNVVDHAQLAIEGDNLDLMDFEEGEVKSAKVFWNAALPAVADATH